MLPKHLPSHCRLRVEATATKALQNRAKRIRGYKILHTLLTNKYNVVACSYLHSSRSSHLCSLHTRSQLDNGSCIFLTKA